MHVFEYGDCGPQGASEQLHESGENRIGATRVEGVVQRGLVKRHVEDRSEGAWGEESVTGTPQDMRSIGD
jgi:hypothetical protein